MLARSLFSFVLSGNSMVFERNPNIFLVVNYISSDWESFIFFSEKNH